MTTTAEGMPLTAGRRVYRERGRDDYEAVPVLDAHGQQIHEGELVRVLTDDHTWTAKGQILVATGASSNGIDAFSVQYQTHDGSQSAISSALVEVAENEVVRHAFEVAHLRHRLANVVRRTSAAELEREQIESALAKLEPDGPTSRPIALLQDAAAYLGAGAVSAALAAAEQAVGDIAQLDAEARS